MSELREVVAKAERIGVIGSPSSTAQIKLDVLATAVHKQLVGTLVFFLFNQEGRENCALGQITEINLRNPWVEDPTMRGLIRQKGRVDPITERQDTHTANMIVGAVFAENMGLFEQGTFGTVAATGTPIYLVDDEVLDAVLFPYMEEIFYLGRVYGARPLLPMWLRHFGKEKGGIGEAYHIGIFGKTGSGKSVLAIMMMLGYARHKNISIFVLDPQGQFSRVFKEDIEIKRIVEKELSRRVEIISLYNLVLSGYDLFKMILITSNFLRRWCSIIHEDNQERAITQIVDILEGRISGQTTIGQTTNEIKPWDAHKRDSFDRVWNTLVNSDQIQRRIYTSQERRETMVSAIQSANPDEVYEEWRKIANLFSYEGKTNAKKIKDLVKEITQSEAEGRILIIDLSETGIPKDMLWNDNIKFVIIGEFLDKIAKEGEARYRENKLLNSLVIIDEAHRLAPREIPESEHLKRVKEVLLDAVRTTRKYGLGWLFISQTLSSLDREIINQLRLYIFGFGLGWGTELRALEEIIGGNREAINLYQSFRDPQSSLGIRKEYPFMSIGPISPLSFSGTPLFFTAFDFPVEFSKKNFGKQNGR